MHAFVDTLLALDTAPTLTITASLDRRRPVSHDDRIRFRNLVAEGRDRLAELPDRAIAERIRRHLDDAVAEADLGGGAHGIVVVATAEHAEVRPLPFPVRDAVSMAETPATRYLVQGLRRSPPLPGPGRLGPGHAPLRGRPRPARRGRRPRVPHERARRAPRPAGTGRPLRAPARSGRQGAVAPVLP